MPSNSSHIALYALTFIVWCIKTHNKQPSRCNLLILQVNKSVNKSQKSQFT